MEAESTAAAPAYGSADAATAIAGLDDILGGGFSRGKAFLVEGEPGCGKTTVAMQFMLEGARRNENSLYITLSETEAELRENAASHGWTLPASVRIFELAPPESLLDANQQQSLLHAAELELGESIRKLFDVVDEMRPDRVVIDSLSELRLLAQNSLRYRRQLLTIKHHFARRGVTVLMLDDMTTEALDKTAHSITHGVLRLEQLAPGYGAERRRLRVLKYRGRKFRGGYHDFVIVEGGVRVFPRLVATEHKSSFSQAALSSGNRELDSLLGGGVDGGSSTLLIGGTGTGKSLIALVFLAAAVARGDKAAIFIFDEERNLLFKRVKAFGIDLEAMHARGDILVEQVDVAEMSPGEFAHRVRAVIEDRGIKIVAIDSLTGYQASMPDETSLILHLHELILFMNRQGVTTFLTLTQHGLVGDMSSPVDLTFLADTVLNLRYFEAAGSIRRAMSVVKKRTGAHETTIREYRLSDKGLFVGDPLTNFQGVLRGTPTFTGQHGSLIGNPGP